MYPEQDSNLHAIAGTAPSRLRVYQFHHLGIFNLTKLRFIYILLLKKGT